MSIEYRRTISTRDIESDAVVLRLYREVAKAHEWAKISDSYPVYINGLPYYTVTITAGSLE